MALVMAGGAVLSFSPEMISIGPRSGFLLSALASVKGLRLAVAAWNSGVPEAGEANVAYSCLASSSLTALAKAERDWSLGGGTARWWLAGLPRNGEAARSAGAGSGRTAPIGAEPLAADAARQPPPP